MCSRANFATSSPFLQLHPCPCYFFNYDVGGHGEERDQASGFIEFGNEYDFGFLELVYGFWIGKFCRVNRIDFEEFKVDLSKRQHLSP
ncbi:unnamed protein product [Linum trigynum]|uniref:Uncharacterized protein n=1 Tax=Linum trigynum TaxID=586398 RepID=A0AAV2DZ30_9ROSI